MLIQNIKKIKEYKKQGKTYKDNELKHLELRSFFDADKEIISKIKEVIVKYKVDTPEKILTSHQWIIFGKGIVKSFYYKGLCEIEMVPKLKYRLNV